MTTTADADPLSTLVSRFDLHARVFFSGNLCSLVNFDPGPGVGHLHILRSGSTTFIGPDARTVRLERPSLLFYPREVRHRLVPDEPDGADLVCASVEFGAQYGNPLVHGMPEVLVLPLDEAPQIERVLQAFFDEAFSQHQGRNAALDRLAEVIVIQLMRHAIARGHMTSKVMAAMGDPRLARVLAALHAQPAEDWTLVRMADVAGMSRARFAAHFTSTVGAPPGDYLTAWRISMAQGLLARGKQVKAVAGEVGYGSPNALTRAFAARLGLTPTEWLTQRGGTP
jgi:AraC-like DNA-binding protein